MKIIHYQESYSSVMLRKLWPPALVFLALMASIFLITFVLPIFVKSLGNNWWVLLIVGLIALRYSLNKFDFIIDTLHGFYYGRAGEEKVIETLENTLDDSYTHIANYLIPNTRIGDIDGILVGPKGIVILEVKNYVGVFRISGDDMYRRLKGDIYKLYRKSPFKQTIRQKECLTKFLKDKGLDTRVLATIVLVSGKITHINGEPGVFITEVSKLTNHIFELSPVTNWSEEMGNKIISAIGVSQK